MSTTEAMVFSGVGTPLSSERLDVDEPRDDLVRVRIRASGVCHSDLHVVNGDWTAETPIVLGHEGSGEVEAAGPAVRDVRPGDHVVLSWFAPCRRCRACASGRAWACAQTRSVENRLPDGSTPLRRADGGEVWPYLGLGTWAERVLVPESAVVPIPAGVPFGVAALIGCSVTTGVGAVLNTAGVRAGESAVVIGCGGVGQAILLGLALVGANPVVAVDLSEDRLAQARALGATVTFRGDDEDLVDRVRDATGGADHAFEAIGLPRTIEMLPALLGAGGTAVVVGMPAIEARATFSPFDLADQGKRILGCNYGSSVPGVDFPRIAALYLAGRLPLDRLIGRTRPLAEADEALADLTGAVGLRTILE